MDLDKSRSVLPSTIGLCSDPVCAQECYMPDPTPGDKCPYCPNDLVIFTRSAKTITHGRHCTCSSCAREDWTNPDLAPCGMHGVDCPALYRPWGPAGTELVG